MRHGATRTSRQGPDLLRPHTLRKVADIDISGIANGSSTRAPLPGDVEISVEVFDVEGRRVVEAALLNTAITGRELPPKLWMFQAELEVTAPNGDAVFLPARDAMASDRGSRDPEVRRLDLLYRDRLEFAVAPAQPRWIGTSPRPTSVVRQRSGRPGFRRRKCRRPRRPR